VVRVRTLLTSTVRLLVVRPLVEELNERNGPHQFRLFFFLKKHHFQPSLDLCFFFHVSAILWVKID
jgi:hypothetical protein